MTTERLELNPGQSLRIDGPFCGLIVRVSPEGFMSVAYVDDGDVSEDMPADRINTWRP